MALMEQSILLSNYRSNVGKIDKKIREATGDVAYPTGFLTLDYLNGAMIHVKNSEKNMDFSYPSVGVLDGAGTMLIGRTGCGKSTLMLQMAANIIRPYKTSAIFYNDIEGGMADSSMETLCRMTSDELKGRLYYRNEGITIENVYKTVQWISDEKTNNRDIYEYDTGLYNAYGERIYKLEPTIVCIDSWPVLMPESVVEEEEMSGQMTTTGTVKRAADLVKRMIAVEKAANIIIFTINHIMDDVQIGVFKKKTQTAYLKQGERLPGGKTALYLANNMFRLDDGTKLKDSEGLGVSGFIVDISCVKSRTNKGGKSVPLVFTGARGFDPDLSMYYYMKSEGYIMGAGASFYIKGYETMKFSQKGFLEKLYTDVEFQKAFVTVAHQALQPLLSERIYTEEQQNKSNIFDINKMVLEMNAVAA